MSVFGGDGGHHEHWSYQRTPTNEVKALDPYMLMAVVGKRVIHPGGRIYRKNSSGGRISKMGTLCWM